MRKKGILMIIIAGIISAIYILGIEKYSSLPMKMAWIDSKINDRQSGNDGQMAMADYKIVYEEMGVKITGITYGETLTVSDMLKRAGNMALALSHEDSCSKICQIAHGNHALIERMTVETGLGVKVTGGDAVSSYTFTIRNQKDNHYNSYYELKITNKGSAAHIDQLKGHGEELLKDWKAETKEFIYFRGNVLGEKDKETRQLLVNDILCSLDAVQTNYYEDDIAESTCSYYGYCPYIDESYKEENGYLTNMQIAFQYNEIKDQTGVVVAFPFYNEVF